VRAPRGLLSTASRQIGLTGNRWKRAACSAMIVADEATTQGQRVERRSKTTNQKKSPVLANGAFRLYQSGGEN